MEDSFDQREHEILEENASSSMFHMKVNPIVIQNEGQS